MCLPRDYKTRLFIKKIYEIRTDRPKVERNPSFVSNVSLEEELDKNLFNFITTSEEDPEEDPEKKLKRDKKRLKL